LGDDIAQNDYSVLLQGINGFCDSFREIGMLLDEPHDRTQSFWSNEARKVEKLPACSLASCSCSSALHAD
jgi:hypothetical protein